MIDFNTIFADLKSMGVYDYILPFLLIFAIIFAILEKTKIFGTEEGGTHPRTNINTVIALLVALIVVVRTEVITVMNNYLSKMTLVIVIVIIFLLLVGLFGANTEGFSGWWLFGFFIVGIIAVFWALSSQELGWVWPWGSSNSGDIGVILTVIAFIIVIVAMTAGSRRRTGSNSLQDELVKGIINRRGP